MTTLRSSFVGDRSGNAAVEMALMLPVLLVLFMGSIELGRYFLDQHVIIKAVRDAARFAARGNFTDYYDTTAGNCRATPEAAVVAATRNLALTGRTTANQNWRVAYWDDPATVALAITCFTNVTATSDGATSTQQMKGIYLGSPGAPVVTVTASVPYKSLFGEIFGIGGPDLTVHAREQAAVTGI